MEECKQEVREIFEQSLAKRGIQPGSNRLSSKQLESRMESLRSEQEGRAKVVARTLCEDTLSDMRSFGTRRAYFV